MTLPLSSPPTPIVPRLHVVTQPGDRPVSLSELQVSVEISGALAITTWQLTFENPNNRPLEGQLEFPLLAGQTIVRFAMDVDGHLRDAVPVPKAGAARSSRRSCAATPTPACSRRPRATATAPASTRSSRKPPSGS